MFFTRLSNFNLCEEVTMTSLKRNSLWLMVISAISLMFTATSAEANCSKEDLDSARCLVIGGYVVRVDSADFPIQHNDWSTTFLYQIYKLPGTSNNISTINMLVPVCNDDFNLDGIVDNWISVATGDPNGWKSYPPGQGSSNTNYGAGVYQYSVFEQSFNSAGSFYLHTTKASAEPTSIAFKIGSKLHAGTILGPTCYKPQIAGASIQVVPLDPLNPQRFITIMKNADGSLEAVFDENNNPLPLENFASFPLWVCVDPILDASGNYLGCSSPFLPITHMPDGIGRFGTHTCYTAFVGGRLSTTCY
jgi:hypothetical protein